MAMFVLRRVLAAAALLVLVPSLAYVFFLRVVRDLPVWPALGDYWLDTYIRFDLGQVQRFGRQDIAELLREGVPVDLALLAGGLVLGLGTGIGAGVFVAARPRSQLTKTLHILGAVALATPVATTGFVIVTAFGANGGEVRLPFVSDTGVYQPLWRDPAAFVQALWVPALAVALPIAGAIMRLASSTTGAALAEDCIRTARAKGISEARVLLRHALPLAIPPIAAYSAAIINLVILNAAIMEALFNLPGSFRAVPNAAEDADIGAMQALTLLTVTYVVVGNLLADLTVARLDPRTR